MTEACQAVYTGLPAPFQTGPRHGFHQCGISRWREIRTCNDNACGESEDQNSPDSFLDCTFLIAATDPKEPIY